MKNYDGRKTKAGSVAPAWFCQELEKNIPVLRRYAHKLMPINKQDARDLIQDTCERALRKHYLFERGTNMTSWLVSIMHNTYVNEIRRLARLPEFTVTEEVMDVPMRPQQEQLIRCRDIVKQYNRLDLKQKFTLGFIVDKHSYDDVATRMNVPVGTVRSRLSRARTAMRTMLKEGAIIR